MLKETDIKQVQCMAKTLLYTDIHIDETIPIFCHHPFFGQTVFYDPKNKIMLDLTMPEQLQQARDIMTDLIFETKDYYHILMLTQKPYLPAMFKYTEEFLGEKDFASSLRYLWTSTEFPNNDKNVSLSEFKQYFRQANQELLMDEDYEEFKQLPDKITVYRGVHLQGTAQALSWTTDKSKAEWFAKRFGNGGKVYEATINKKDVFAYFPSTGESEIVLNDNKLENVKEISHYKREENIR